MGHILQSWVSGLQHMNLGVWEDVNPDDLACSKGRIQTQGCGTRHHSKKDESDTALVALTAMPLAQLLPHSLDAIMGLASASRMSASLMLALWDL